MKYKTQKLFDDMKDSNTYIEIDKNKDANQAKIVEDKVQQGEDSQQDSSKLTLTTAMNKYFYPRVEKLTDYKKRIDDVYSKINAGMPQKPKRKHVGIRVVLETLLSLGFGFAGLCVYNLITNSMLVVLMLLVGGISTAVFGAIVGIVDNLAYKIGTKRKNKIKVALNNQLVGIIAKDKQHIDLFVKNVNDFKSKINLKTQTATDDITNIQTNIANFNKEIYSIVENIYDVSKNEKLMDLVKKYKNLENCYSDTKQIIKDLNELKKILPTLSIYAPQIIDKDNTDVIYSFRNEESKLLIKTIIPFAQVLNVTYDKVYQNYCDKQRRDEEKLLQEQERLKEEEKRRNEIKLEEERLRKEMEQKEFEKENKKYKNFFDEYGVDEELDQEEKTE